MTKAELIALLTDVDDNSEVLVLGTSDGITVAPRTGAFYKIQSVSKTF